jgi:peptidoglycan biosynthesis protein MviN/MurJ (putative lipid II flippase)
MLGRMSTDTLPPSRPRLRYGLSYLAAALVGILASAVLLFLVAETQSVYHGWGDWGVTMVTAIFGLYVVPAMFAASLLAPALAGLLHQRASWVGYGLLFGAIYVIAALVVCAGCR